MSRAKPHFLKWVPRLHDLLLFSDFSLPLGQNHFFTSFWSQFLFLQNCTLKTDRFSAGAQRNHTFSWFWGGVGFWQCRGAHVLKLCAGAVNGDTCARLVYTKPLLFEPSKVVGIYRRWELMPSTSLAMPSKSNASKSSGFVYARRLFSKHGISPTPNHYFLRCSILMAWPMNLKAWAPNVDIYRQLLRVQKVVVSCRK